MEDSNKNKDEKINIKLEEIDIDQEGDSYISIHQMIDYDNLQQDSKDFDLHLPKTENVFLNEDMQTESKYSINMLTGDEILDTTRNIHASGSFPYPGGSLLNVSAKNLRKRPFNIEYLFEDKEVFIKIDSIFAFDLSICKICSFSSKKGNLGDIYNHASIHTNKIGTKWTPKNIRINFDYYVCTLCHIRIMKKDDIQIHMQIHKTEMFSNAIVDVKTVQNLKGKKAELHCCEICNAAFTKYLGIFIHLKDHHPEEADDVVEAKYNDNLNPVSSGHSLETPFHNGGTIKQTRHVEVEIDNTGKYIPYGWQRKVYQSSKRGKKGRYMVSYISPFGHSLYAKSGVSKYIEKLESDGITLLVSLEDLNFSILSHKLPKVVHRPKKRRFFFQPTSCN
ncbi:unnamed protein product [Meganyctiphanes norvegica]|uniref:MBD domain-containing protein n=1 Tax=Meganyctiphanes norvegica TaxID=48144 RepID=A0AAV2PW27_MEGNR